MNVDEAHVNEAADAQDLGEVSLRGYYFYVCIFVNKCSFGIVLYNLQVFSMFCFLIILIACDTKDD